MQIHPTEHWVCFSCRKQFRKPSRWNGIHWEWGNEPGVAAYPCPECKSPMTDMGRFFRAPRRSDLMAWEQMRLLAEHGIRFTDADDIAFERIREGKKPRKRQTLERIAHCPCQWATPGQQLLRGIAQNLKRKRRK